MASSASRPLHRDLFLSRSFFPSPSGSKGHSIPHLYPLSATTAALLHEFPMLSVARSHASNVAEKIPQREETCERNAKNHARHKDAGSPLPSLSSLDERVERNDRKAENRPVVKEKMVELGAGKQRIRSKGRGSRSGTSSFGSRVEGGARKSKKIETLGRSHGEMEEKKGIKKAEVSAAEVDLRLGLDMCSKTGDVMGAISLYDSAVRDGVKMEQYHYNVLLYLCSSAAIGVVRPAKSGTGGSSIASFKEDASDLDQDRDLADGRNPKWQLSGDIRGEGQLQDVLHHYRTELRRKNLPRFDVGKSRDDLLDGTNESSKKYGVPIQFSDDAREYARRRGFEIYEKMCLEKIPMSEAALTSVARMAMSMGNGDMAFEIVKQMKVLGITPRLRSYGPALLVFCNGGDIEKAFEVEKHMLESGIHPEEPELEALLRATVAARRGDKVYYLLHKLRTNVRQVSPPTAELIEAWFKSSTASRVGKRKWDVKMVAQAIQNGGGGWHGLGWLGKGKWTMAHTNVDADGVCLGCGEKLVTIDLDPIETATFAKSVASIASKRERNTNFQKFQKWLDYYGPFEAVVDAANVGLFSQRRFSINKVNAVVNAIRQKLPSKKWPLIIVHNKRLSGGKMDEPINGKLIEKWRNADAIYATPTGSNDDWYWLYAAIKCKCLIVTNDEMRDHIFQILGNDFFSKWKERHQVRFSYHDGNFEFHMPPPCSVVIQESEKGHWHIPISVEHDESERERTWLCVTRARSHMMMEELSNSPKEKQPEKMAISPTLYIGASNQIRSSESPKEKVMRSPQRNIADRENSNTIISSIEAAEELCGCVIDFQI
ncbi:proteinaceous RNase P 1, chloroplastic/mitochondrial-like isoform X1 [Phoenix dactylifera]|uniref:ribonuclease P n=1 Tax=Phoenix dactylifera TaxID=42345 RepID=A0A8B7BFU1_PHODC|nr:proteinaceous RNase P 1, chloroplastic/mitochondrial-like isoform X1 [Phoenix dactylifera]